VRLLQEISDAHRLPKFTIGYFYSELPVREIADRIDAGHTTAGLDGRSPINDEDLRRTDRAVAVAGVHPFIELLRQGADVIVGGRCSDAAIFAAPALLAGANESEAYCLGKIAECASFCAEPYGAKESVIGTITGHDVLIAAMSPDQRCTVASVAGHAMYERASPLSEHFLGGQLDLTNCVYTQHDERTCRVSGAKFIPADPLAVKLEGAGRVGERYIGIVGVRDPYTIAHIDDVFAWVRDQIDVGAHSLYFHAYGRDAVMGPHEPTPQPAHELGVVIEAVAPSASAAEEVCMTALRQMFYARLPDVKGTAGSAAFLCDEVLRATPACEWTLNHTITVADPLELFERHIVTAGV